LRKIFFDHFGNPSNKETFATRSFNVGISIDGRNYLSNNADVNVDLSLRQALIHLTNMDSA
jgi:hypothetical protein